MTHTELEAVKSVIRETLNTNLTDIRTNIQLIVGTVQGHEKRLTAVESQIGSKPNGNGTCDYEKRKRDFFLTALTEAWRGGKALVIWAWHFRLFKIAVRSMALICLMLLFISYTAVRIDPAAFEKLGKILSVLPKIKWGQ